MATLLFIVIYISYISLGLPDSLFGTAWPAIYQDLNLPVSYASFVTTIISVGTIISSLFSTKIINKIGTPKVVALSTTMTAFALLGYSFSRNMIFFCLLALPLGLGAGAIDTAMNNYVALHYNANHMNYLHCFYGVGVSISPYLMSLALGKNNDWQRGYRLAFIVQITIAVILILSIPIWKKVNPESNIPEEEKQKNVSIFVLSKRKDVRCVWLMCFASNAIEAICTTWSTSYLVNEKGVLAHQAAKIVIIYFVGLTAGRLVSGILVKRFTSWQLVLSGQALMIASFLILIFGKSYFVAAIGLFLIGFGNGPFFPNMMHLVPVNFGKDISQSVIGTQLAFAYTGILVAPLIMVFFAQRISFAVYPITIALFSAILIGYTIKFKIILSKR